MKRWLAFGLLVPMACGGRADDLGAATVASSSSSGGDVDLLCRDGDPLGFGDASWTRAPFDPPGGNGEPGADEGGYEDGGGTSGVGFIGGGDTGGVNVECTNWDQDCPQGEKCMPWANDGGMDWNATKCSPVDPNGGGAGDMCTVEGSAVSGVDSCDATSMCWEPDINLNGACVPFCTGSEASPMCPNETWCFIGYDGTVIVCLPDALCGDDGACQCMCPDGVDPDCEEGECDGMTPEPPAADELLGRDQASPAEAMCPETQDPVVLYMSNDDSNSQASPILARQIIEEGGVVPRSKIRIHEFLNYYTLTYDNPTDKAAEVGIQMRRTSEDGAEFTLVLSARGREMTAQDRPPMNVVFSADTSGSMAGRPIQLLRDSMTAAAGSLREGDIVSIVEWDVTQDVVLDGYVVTGPDDPELLGIISRLDSGGGTDLHGGLVSAYRVANDHRIKDGINRVFLISDGGANVGVTDIDLIASESQDQDGEGIYMVGVGVGHGSGYRDDLMNAVTDAGKGAYIYVDSVEEADRQFGKHFLANTIVVARNVQMQLTLPWYFGIRQFHGEEYSADPAEVEPQHLAPNDVMTFHQIIAACDPSLITACDQVRARVEYTDPLTGDVDSDTKQVPIEDLVVEDSRVLRKSDTIVGYAKALIVIADHVGNDESEQAAAVAGNTAAWVRSAADTLSDAELAEIADLLAQYKTRLETFE